MVLSALRQVARGFGLTALLLFVPLFAAAQATVTINQAPAQGDPTNASPILFTVVFSQAVIGFTGADVSFSGSTVGGTLVASASPAGTASNFTVSVTGMTGVGTVVASIPSNVVLGGNFASTSTDNQVTFETVRPTVTINQAPAQSDPTDASPILFSVVFSEAVAGFSGADVSLAGSTLGGLVAAVSGSGANYTVSVTGMNGVGTVVAGIPANGVTDLAGNLNFASSSIDNQVAFDNVRPTVTINQAPAQADPTNASPILYSVVFSEAVVGFNAADVSFAGSTVGGTLVAGVSGSGANYTVSVTGMNGVGNVVVSIPANAVTDLAGNTNFASTSTDNSVTFDNVRPTVTINRAPAQADPTNASPILYSVVFSEAVLGFGAPDVSFAGSTVGGTLVANVSGTGASYTVAVTGMTGSGTAVVSITVNATQDLAGNPSFASTSTDNQVTFDTARPTVTINQAGAQADPTTASPILFTVVFSEAVTGFTGADVSFAGSTAGGTLAAFVSGSGANYTVSATGMTSTGTVVASIPANGATDLAGNLNFASTSIDNAVTANVRPTVTINQGPAQADPTNASPVVFAVAFSAPVTGFTGADISFAGSTVGGALVANVTGTGASYTVSVTGMIGTGVVVASIPANAAADIGANLSFASTSIDNMVTFETVRPTVAINTAGGQADPTTSSPIAFTVAFSEAVTGFTGADVSFAGSTAGGALSANVTGSGASYTVSVTGMATSGTVVASIPANGATDLAGNLSFASTSTDNTVTFIVLGSALSPSPGSLDFGGQSMNTTAPAIAVTITNVSAAQVNLTSLTPTASYSGNHNCGALAPGGACTANVTFTPAAEGSIPGTLTVTNGTSSISISLAGVGERSLVTHYYRAILRRSPDAGGKAFWLGEALRVQAAGLDVNEVWFAMAQQFFGSAEYLAQNRDDAGFVADLYNTFFNRAPDGPGLAFWTSQLAGGMPREVALVAFMFSAEFVNFTQAIFGTSTVRAEVNVVTDFYRGLLSRLPDNGGFAFWLARFRAAQCAGAAAVTAEAEAISSAFALSGEYAGRGRANPAYVGDLYNAFLRRGGDLGGVLFWIGEINSGARSRENVRLAFVGSAEFQSRVAQVIAAGCQQ